jgi:large subunit ribosomal protein L47
MLRISRIFLRTVPATANMTPATRNFGSTSTCNKGFEDFYDKLKPDEVMSAGRAWIAADLRKKSFNDLHALWWILYKERNLLLTLRQTTRQKLMPMPQLDENRYIRVKRSMAAIKLVLDERKKIDALLKEKAAADQTST